MDSGFNARQIVKSCRSGALASIDRNDGSPYVSFCACAIDGRGEAVFLFSDLADHTQNILKEGRVSFLCEQASMRSNPQSGPRVTLVGQMEKTTDDNLCRLFLQFHPSAKMYADFGDFNFYRLKVEKAHFVGGFGRAQWLEKGEYLGDSAASLNFSRKQVDVIAQLNADFPTLAVSTATKKIKQRGKNWEILRVDSDGMDLKLASKIIRYPFDIAIKTEEELFELAQHICA